MKDLLFKDALKRAIENIQQSDIEGDFATTTDMLNAFNQSCFCAVTFTLTPSTAELIVRDSNGDVVTAEEGGAYNLVKGDYTYTATAEGYTPIEDEDLAIAYSDVTTGTKTVTVTLTEETP